MKSLSTSIVPIVAAGVAALLSACSTPSQPPTAATPAASQSSATTPTQPATAASPAAAASASSTPAKPTTPTKSDFDAIQGKWKGEETGADEGTASLAISGHDIEYHGANPNDWYKGTFTLREDSTPRQVVFVVTGCGVPDYVGKNCLAIYQIANGALTIAGNEPGNPNPPSTFGAEGSRTFKFKLQ